ncbi:hypothetical protein [Methanothrix harundinacea]|uniref:hypothetical protein n=1 Tax=Methanothrix harundinacea TaxID=301375 RepID=UPI00117C2D1A|nr:hypothetical protein [Methanothrix harundinacea]
MAAFFAVPAMADCTGPDCLCGFQAVDFSLGDWPANANVKLVSSGEQRAFAFWNGQAFNDLKVENDQNAGMLYQEGFPKPACASTLGTCTAADQMGWDTRVVNIERVSSGNQFATATGGAIARNSISVCATQGAAAGCDCCDCDTFIAQ